MSINGNYNAQNELTGTYGKYMSKVVRIANAIGTFGISELDPNKEEMEETRANGFEYFARYTPVNYLVNGDVTEDNKSTELVEKASRFVAQSTPFGLIFGDAYVDTVGKYGKLAYKYSASNMIASLFLDEK